MQKVIHSDFDLLFLKVNSFASVIRISGSKYDGLFFPFLKGHIKLQDLEWCAAQKQQDVT